LVSKSENSEYKTFGFNRNSLDITKSKNVLSVLSEIKPNYVVNCAGWTNVDLAEEFPNEAKAVNAESLIGITKACSDLSIKLIHISSDYVFSGKTTAPYAIYSSRDPVNFYGQTKLSAEKIIEQKTDLNYWILRTSWLYGNSSSDFLSKIINKYFYDESSINVVEDQIGHPTYVKDLAEKILEIIDIEPEYGIYHASNSGYTSWFQFAKQALSILNLDSERLSKIKSVNLKSKINRPQTVILDLSKWQSVGLLPMRNWENALLDCLTKGGSNYKNYTT
jgi:dTDP-4-dehydrorhamnose reductase